MSWFTRKRPYTQFYNASNLSTSHIATKNGSVALPEKIVQQAKNVAMPFCRRPPTLDFSASIDMLANPQTSEEEKKEIIDELVLLRLLVSRDLVAETVSLTGTRANLIPKSWSELSGLEKFVQAVELSTACGAIAGAVSTVANASGIVGNILTPIQQAQTAVSNTATTRDISQMNRAREIGMKVGEVIVVKAASEITAAATGISLIPAMKFMRQRFATKNRKEVVQFLDSLLTEFPGVPEILFSPDYTISSISTSPHAQLVLESYLAELKSRMAPAPIQLANFLKASRRRKRRSRRRGRRQQPRI
jgi:hypothetical protein